MKTETFALPESTGSAKAKKTAKGAGFYPRLALSNMEKNANIYFPYLLAGGLLSGLYYMVLAVGEMVADSGMSGGKEMLFLLEMCAGLCVLIMFLILFYINSFVMKRRKRELGLYCILGMEKRHLCVLLFWEVLTAAVISAAGGILFGALFSQFLFLVLLKLIRIPAKLVFSVPLAAVRKTVLVFGIGYLVTYLYDWGVIRKTNPIDLLRSRQEGEREPKTKWLTALAGIVTLAAGYGMALKVSTVSEGFLVFFPAAFLVIIATYCLFQAGSIVFLKFLRSRKGFYYRPENFISVSGMLYRMKQNAAGLATIAVLSTALLVVLSSSVTLYAGEEDMLNGLYPREYKLTIKPKLQYSSGEELLAAEQSREEHNLASLHGLAQETGVEITADYSLLTAWWMTDQYENHFDSNVLVDRVRNFDIEKMVSLNLISLEDYNGMTGSQEELSADEVILIGSEKEKWETVFINGKEFFVKKQLQQLEEYPADIMNQDMFRNCIVVLPDERSMLRLCGEDASAYSINWYYLFDMQGAESALQDFWQQASGRIDAGGVSSWWFESRSEERESFYFLYGSILFIGILFVCLFLLATALIIYYKQVTEGYDDRQRFEIMEKVGMRDTEIRRAIGKQVLIVFFMPLVTAIVHICVAARVLRMFLAVLGLTSSRVFWIGMAVCCVVFGLVYYVIYRLTSRVYFQIVHGKRKQAE